MVEEDSITGEKIIGLAVIYYNPVREYNLATA
jgi:hypothetical protein